MATKKLTTDKAAVAKKAAAAKVVKAKRPVVLQTGQRLTTAEAAKHAAKQKLAKLKK